MAGEWRCRSLGEVCSFLNRGSAPVYIEDAGVLVLNQKCVRGGYVNFTNGRRTDTARKPVLPERMLQTFDILVNSTGVGTLGRVAQVKELPEPTTVDSHVTIVRPNSEKVEPAYVGFALRWLQVEIESLAEGSTGQTELARGRLAILSIPVPSLPEQRSIAHILGTLDNKIELNRRMNETLEEMARAVFTHHFPYSPDDKLPEGWRVGRIADIAHINAWSLGSKDTLDTIDYVEISEVMRGEIATITPYSRGEEPSRARRRLKHGDTVISTVRPDRGAFFLALNPPQTLIASTGFAVLTPKDGNWAFLHVATTRPEFGQELGRLADGGAYPAVRPEVIAGRAVVIPSDSRPCDAFDKVVQPLFLRIETNRTESRTLTALRDALLPKLLSGEIRIPAVTNLVEAMT